MDALMREAGLHEGMGEEEGMARMQEFMARLSQGTHALLDNRSEELTPVDTDVRDITGAKEEGNMLFAKKDFAGALAAYAKAASYAKEEISPAAEAVFCAVCCNQAVCFLKQGRATDAVAAAETGVALGIAPSLPKLLPKLLLRLCEAREAAGNIAGAREAAQLATALSRADAGLRAERTAALSRFQITRPQWAAPSDDRVAQAIGTVFGSCKTSTEAVEALLATFRPGGYNSELHVDARDEQGHAWAQALLCVCCPYEEQAVNNVLWAACMKMGEKPSAALAALIRGLLQLGARANQRFQSGRTPVMYAASACTREGIDVVRQLLDAGAAVNSCDDQGWTALHRAGSNKRVGNLCGEMVRLLLSRRARVDLVTVAGQTPLACLCLAADHHADRLDAVQALLADPRSAATLAVRNWAGYTAFTTALTEGKQDELTKVVAKAMEEAGLGELVVEERKADRLQRLQDEWAKEHNAALAPTLTRKNRTVEEDAVAGAKSELIWAGMILKAAGLPADPADALAAHENPLLAVHAWVLATYPGALLRLYDAAPERGSLEDAMLRRCLRRGKKLGREKPGPGKDLKTAPLLLPYHYDTAADALLRPRLCWSGLSEHFDDVIVSPLRRAFSHGIPTAEALDALAELSPILEVGAGSGYWAVLLRRRGVDVVATDWCPPDERTLANKFHTRPFVGADVQAADGAEAATKHPDRALFFCWSWSPSTGTDGDKWDVLALRAYRGDTVAVCGEWKGQTIQRSFEYGITHSEEFQVEIKRHFECVRRVALPGWPCNAIDDLSIWKRRRAVTTLKS